MKGKTIEVLNAFLSFTHPQFIPIQTCVSEFLLLSIKDDVLKTIGNQTVAGS